MSEAKKETIVIECPECGLSKSVDRQPYDPAEAVTAYIYCEECSIGAMEPPTWYFDKDGNDIHPA